MRETLEKNEKSRILKIQKQDIVLNSIIIASNIIMLAIFIYLFEALNIEKNIYIYSLIILGVMGFLLPLKNSILKILDKKEHLSHIIIDDAEIKLEYEIGDTKTNSITIEKDKIQKFHINTYLDFKPCGFSIIKYEISINLADGRKIHNSSIVPLITREDYKYIFEFLEVSSEIPNFELEFNSNSEQINTEFNYRKNLAKNHS